MVPVTKKTKDLILYHIKVGDKFYRIPSMYSTAEKYEITEHTVSRLEKDGSDIAIYADDIHNGEYPALEDNMVNLINYYVVKNHEWFGMDKETLLDYHNSEIIGKIAKEEEEKDDYMKRYNARVNLLKDHILNI